MNYIEYNVNVSDAEQGEIAIAFLAEMGFESFSDFLTDGFTTGANSVKCYIVDSVEVDTRDEIETYLGREGLPFERTEIEQQNWNAEWESNFEPIYIEDENGCKCYIRAPFHDEMEAGCEIIIMPKMSFGTGHHATTHLMAERILSIDFGGSSVLDMGSGTGILAILAALRGAVSVDAVDIDEWAYENCLENIQTNTVQRVVCPILGDVKVIEGRLYDCILANINRNILLRDMEQYVAALRKGGLILVSGILDFDADVIIANAQTLGLQLSDTNSKDGWRQITFIKL